MLNFNKATNPRLESEFKRVIFCWFKSYQTQIFLLKKIGNLETKVCLTNLCINEIAGIHLTTIPYQVRYVSGTDVYHQLERRLNRLSQGREGTSPG